jgi:hypothetical protein
MPDTDSGPVVVPSNDLRIMTGARQPSPYDGAAAHRFARSCNEIGFHTAFDEAGLSSRATVDRGFFHDSVINPNSALAADSRRSDPRRSQSQWAR